MQNQNARPLSKRITVGYATLHSTRNVLSTAHYYFFFNIITNVSNRPTDIIIFKQRNK